MIIILAKTLDNNAVKLKIKNTSFKINISETATNFGWTTTFKKNKVVSFKNSILENSNESYADFPLEYTAKYLKKYKRKANKFLKKIIKLKN